MIVSNIVLTVIAKCASAPFDGGGKLLKDRVKKEENIALDQISLVNQLLQI